MTGGLGGRIEAGVRDAGIAGLNAGSDPADESSILVRFGRCLLSLLPIGVRLEPEAARFFLALPCVRYSDLMGSGYSVSLFESTVGVDQRVPCVQDARNQDRGTTLKARA